MRARFLLWCSVLALGLATAASAAGPDNLDRLFPSARRHATDLKLALSNMNQASPGAAASEAQFLVPIPAGDWIEDPAAPFLGDSEGLLAYQSPQGPGAGWVGVSQVKLERELNPMDWLRLTADAAGWQELALRWEEGRAGPVFNLLARKEEDAQGRGPWLARMAVHRVGQRLFVIQAMALGENFADLALPFAATALMFEPDRDPKPILAGSWRACCLREPVCFLGPGLPQPHVCQPGDPVDVKTFKLTRDDRRTGVLQVWSTPAAAQRNAVASIGVGAFLRNLWAQGYRPGKVLEQKTIDYPALGGEGYYLRQGISKNGESWEVFLMTVTNPRLIATVWLLTPAPENQPVDWAYNKRTFELVAWSLQPRREGGS